MENKKAFQLALSTVIIVVIAFLALTVVSTYIFRGFGTAGAGVSDVGEGAGNQTEEFKPGEVTEGAVYGGVCKGTLSSGAEECGYYYDKDYSSGPAQCPISSCAKIDAVIHNPDDDLGKCSYGGDLAAVCIESCSDLTSVGKETCICAGCAWESK